MSDQENKVDSTDARQASMSRVQTQETVFAKLANANPASEDADQKAQETVKDGEPKPKQTAQERIAELANKRREAEAKATEAQREVEELRERLKRLETSAPAIEVSDRPQRVNYPSAEAYEDALIDWKADQRIAEREHQQRMARINAEAQVIDQTYEFSLNNAKAKFDDFTEVVSSATTNIPDFLVMAIKESPVGGEVTYYLAKHKEEAERIAAMRPIQAIKALTQLEKDLTESSDDVLIEKPKQAAKQKAPEPINPVKGSAAINPAAPRNFEEYRAQRKAKR